MRAWTVVLVLRLVFRSLGGTGSWSRAAWPALMTSSLTAVMSSSCCIRSLLEYGTCGIVNHIEKTNVCVVVVVLWLLFFLSTFLCTSSSSGRCVTSPAAKRGVSIQKTCTESWGRPPESQSVPSVGDAPYGTYVWVLFPSTVRQLIPSTDCPGTQTHTHTHTHIPFISITLKLLRDHHCSLRPGPTLPRSWWESRGGGGGIETH